MKKNVTFNLDIALMEKVRNIAFRNRTSLNDAVTDALQHMIRVDVLLHGPCEPRTKELNRGRKLTCMN